MTDSVHGDGVSEREREAVEVSEGRTWIALRYWVSLSLPKLGLGWAGHCVCSEQAVAWGVSIRPRQKSLEIIRHLILSGRI